jgi:hypothetical protein
MTAKYDPTFLVKTIGWADTLEKHIVALELQAADLKKFYPPHGAGHKLVQGDIAVLRSAITRLEKLNRAN